MNPPANYALSSVRKTQFLIAGFSLPCAIAAVIDKNGSAETILQLTWVLTIPYDEFVWTEESQLTLAI